MKGYIWYQRNKAYLKNAMICTSDKLYICQRSFRTCLNYMEKYQQQVASYHNNMFIASVTVAIKPELQSIIVESS